MPCLETTRKSVSNKGTLFGVSEVLDLSVLHGSLVGSKGHYRTATQGVIVTAFYPDIDGLCNVGVSPKS